MKILKIEIDSFGKLREFSLEPGRGITVIEGENESGKSTLLAFLRFALYGFPRKNAPDGDERDKRVSWQTRTAAGRLTLAWKGDAYRITRRFLCRSTAARESVSEELSVEAVAKQLNVSASLLSHAFKKEMNISFYQYVLKKRLTLAFQKIKDGEPAVLVAERCGFHDYSNFYRQYKKAFGVTPSERG